MAKIKVIYAKVIFSRQLHLNIFSLNTKNSRKSEKVFDFTDKLLLYSIFLVHKSSIRLKIAIKSRTNVSIYQQIVKNNVFIKQMIRPMIETPTI